MLPKLKYILCDVLRVLDHIPCDLTNHFRILLRRKEYGMKDLCDLFERDWARLHSVSKAGLKMVKVRWIVFCDGRSFNPIKTRLYFVVNITIQQINFRNKLFFHKDTA